MVWLEYETDSDSAKSRKYHTTFTRHISLSFQCVLQQAHIKPPPPVLPTDVNEYQIPAIDLPDQWKYAINDKGQIYYYHKKILIPQWEPPIRLLPLMEEQRLPDYDFRMEASDRLITAGAANDEHDGPKNDSDDDDEDVVSILSNMKMNAKRLLQLKSDPILEKNIDDDSSSSTSDDSAQQELEMKLNFLKEKTDACWGNFSSISKHSLHQNSYQPTHRISYFPFHRKYEEIAKLERRNSRHGQN